MKVVSLVVEDDRIVGREGGFLAVRRLRLRNRRADGSLSEPYLCDYLVRPKGLDAVVLALYRRRPGGAVEVLLRDGLRPPLALGRPADEAPIPDRRDYLLFTEVVAGILEAEDRGEAGVRRRAAIEAFEEAGYQVAPEAVELLGAAPFPSPGAMVERFWLAAAEVDAAAESAPPPGDGSPMEEGARCRWMELDAAIAACVAGDIEDLKTELVLRRLRDRLG